MAKLVVPVLHRDCKIPFRLRRLQYVDLSLNYSAGLDRLLRRSALDCARRTAVLNQLPQERPTQLRVKVYRGRL